MKIKNRRDEASLFELNQNKFFNSLSDEELICINIIKADPIKFYINENKKFIDYDSAYAQESTNKAVSTLYNNYDWYVLD